MNTFAFFQQLKNKRLHHADQTTATTIFALMRENSLPVAATVLGLTKAELLKGLLELEERGIYMPSFDSKSEQAAMNRMHSGQMEGANCIEIATWDMEDYLSRQDMAGYDEATDPFEDYIPF